MKGGKLPQGYTIIEVMIVLAVSGVLFLIAGNFISGKQERTSFQQGSNEVASRMQSIIEQISDGKFTDVSFVCRDPGAPSQVTIGGAPLPPNQTDCEFLGKLVHFSAQNDDKKYEIFSLAGARSTSGKPVQLQATATPFQDTRLAPIDSNSITRGVLMPQNLDVGTMKVTDINTSVSTTAYNIGFLQGLGSDDPFSGGYQSGAQTIYMVYVAQTLKGQPDPPGAAPFITSGNIHIASSATICVTDGMRSADIVIGGGNNNQLQVEVHQKGVTGAASCP